jgi:hypothetical protein
MSMLTAAAVSLLSIGEEAWSACGWFMLDEGVMDKRFLFE